MGTAILLAFTMSFVAPVEMKPSISLETIPDHSDFFLDNPLSFDIDAQGNYLLADGEARVLFKWDKQGRFQGTIGKPGQGPGEFVFRGRGRAQAFISAVADKLYVFDGGKRQVLVFDGEGQFLEALQGPMARGFVRGFYVTEDERFIYHRTVRGDEGSNTEVVLTDREGKPVKTFRTVEDNSFSRRGTGRENATFTLKMFNPTLTTGFDRASGELLVGYTGEAKFERFSMDGSKKTVALALTQLEVTQADKDEVLNRSDNNGRRRVNYEFPETKPFYDEILPVGDRGYLVYSISPQYRRVSGKLVDRKGAVLGHFEMECGENGLLMGSQGRILAVRLDEDDDFKVEELIPSTET